MLSLTCGTSLAESLTAIEYGRCSVVELGGDGGEADGERQGTVTGGERHVVDEHRLEDAVVLGFV